MTNVDDPKPGEDAAHSGVGNLADRVAGAVIRGHDPEPGRCVGLGAGCPGCIDLYLVATGQDPDRDEPPWCALCSAQHWAWHPHRG